MRKYKIQTDGEQYRVVRQSIFGCLVVKRYNGRHYVPRIFGTEKEARNWIDAKLESYTKPKWVDTDV